MCVVLSTDLNLTRSLKPRTPATPLTCIMAVPGEDQPRALSLQRNEAGRGVQGTGVAGSTWGFRRRPKNLELVGLHEKVYKFRGLGKTGKDHFCHSWASPNCTGLQGKCIVRGIRDLVTMRTVGPRRQVAQRTVYFHRISK